MTAMHSEAVTVLVNLSVPFLILAAGIGVVAWCTRTRAPRANDAKHTRRP